MWGRFFGLVLLSCSFSFFLFLLFHFFLVASRWRVYYLCSFFKNLGQVFFEYESSEIGGYNELFLLRLFLWTVPFSMDSINFEIIIIIINKLQNLFDQIHLDRLMASFDLVPISNFFVRIFSNAGSSVRWRIWVYCKNMKNHIFFVANEAFPLKSDLTLEKVDKESGRGRPSTPVH